MDRYRPAQDSNPCPTATIENPAFPPAEQAVILQWLEDAQQQWREEFPLAEQLCEELDKLKPLMAALAISEPEFLRPGAHPAHQLLDAIQESAVGWQSQLGRAGQPLHREIARIVAILTTSLAAGQPDLAAAAAQIQAFGERERARAGRMIQRLVAAEHGQARAQEAKLHAAEMINAALAKHPATEALGELLKGDWYASAQLVWLKFGSDSRQWQHMTETTTALLESLQPPGEAGPNQRQHLFEVATQLPKALKRWLLSLHHDLQAVGDAVGVIESAHLRLLREQSLTLKQIGPIVEADPAAGSGQEGAEEAASQWQSGQWFSVETQGASVRAQLVLKKDRERQLVFANHAGLKTLELDFAAFAQMLEERQAAPLFTGASFSRCLTESAGIQCMEDLEKLLEHEEAEPQPAVQMPGQEEEEEPPSEQLPPADVGTPWASIAEPASEPDDADEQERMLQEWEQARRRQLKQEAADKDEVRTQFESSMPASDAPDLSTPLAPEPAADITEPLPETVLDLTQPLATLGPGEAGMGEATWQDPPEALQPEEQ